MNEGYADYGMSDDDGELPRKASEGSTNRYSGIPCVVCGLEFGTIAMLERHELRCGKSSKFAANQFLELLWEAQAKRMANGGAT